MEPGRRAKVRGRADKKAGAAPVEARDKVRDKARGLDLVEDKVRDKARGLDLVEDKVPDEEMFARRANSVTLRRS